MHMYMYVKASLLRASHLLPLAQAVSSVTVFAWGILKIIELHVFSPGTNISSTVQSVIAHRLKQTAINSIDV